MGNACFRTPSLLGSSKFAKSFSIFMSFSLYVALRVVTGLSSRQQTFGATYVLPGYHCSKAIEKICVDSFLIVSALSFVKYIINSFLIALCIVSFVDKGARGHPIVVTS